MKSILTLLVSAVTVISISAEAQKRPWDPPANEKSVFSPGFSIGTPIYQGTGCREGTVSTTLSPDKKTLSILFDEFGVQAGPSTGKMVDQRMCRIRIPVNVGPGYQVAVIKTDFRGFNEIEAGASAEIRTVHNFRTAKGPARETRPIIDNLKFEGPLSEEFLTGVHIENDIPWTPCGQPLSMGIGAHLVARGTPTAEAMSTIDSLDVQGDSKGVNFHLFWRRCQ